MRSILAILALTTACVSADDAQPSGTGEVQSAILGTASWINPSCSGTTFTGCAQTNNPVCSDHGGAWYANWDAHQKSICDTACGLPNPNSYCGWVPAQCSGTTFVGCRQSTQAQACTDYGGPSYPNWTSAAWSTCQAACSNPAAACGWAPATIVGGTFTGCARTGQPTCSDSGSSQFSNWNQSLHDACVTDCTSTCPAANPNDNVPDDAALQACLNAGGTIKLVPGSVGYIIASGITITKSNTTLTSAAAPGRARLVAAAGLNHVMLQAVNLSNINVSSIELDGNRPSRTTKQNCSGSYNNGYRIAGTNMHIYNVTGGVISNVRSTRALCGSALEFYGTMEITNNLFDNNGAGTEALAGEADQPWSDGLTLGDCRSSNVHDNSFLDNTDVDLPVGGGVGCQIRNNSIFQLNRHAFAGLQLGNFQGSGNGNFSNALVSGNRIYGNGRMSFGLGLSMMPWANLRISGGTVTGNYSSGAVVNLMVQGADGLTLSNHTFGSTTASSSCGGAAQYTASDAPGSSLQAGWVSRSFGPPPNNCIP